MSEEPKRLPINPSLKQLQKRAKERVREVRAAGDESATLSDAQFAIAREYGFTSWAKLKQHIEALRPPGIESFEKLVDDLARAYTTADETSVRAINANHGTKFPTDFHDAEKMKQSMPTWYASETRTAELAIGDAQQMVAHTYGFDNWTEFAASFGQPAPTFVSARRPFYTIDWEQNQLAAHGPQSRKDWQQIFAVVAERGISKLKASGITDDAMKELASLACVTSLDLSGSKELTDIGARHLAEMPQLTELEMGGRHAPISEQGFGVLRQLNQLRRFKCCWTPGFNDAAAANLGACSQLESVDAMGTMAGDALIRALGGKTKLRFLDTGRSVTDAGVALLCEIPAFKQWQGGGSELSLMGESKLPNRLMIDGDFTDAGLAALSELEGVAALSFFWHSKAFTPKGLAALRHLPHLQVFGIDGAQCGDEAMRQIATIPGLRQLQAQGAVAGDAGWHALAHAKSLEYVWGRECPNFGSQAFRALAELPALKGMGISCRLVDDDALAMLPRFPALREFVPIDFEDAEFRHVGHCEDLEALYCMYCRDTGDLATGHISGLRKLRTYYAGMTQITDESLALLGRMEALETLEFWQCMAISDTGIAHLAALPRLKRVEIHGSPKVSRSVRRMFRDAIRLECT